MGLSHSERGWGEAASLHTEQPSSITQKYVPIPQRKNFHHFKISIFSSVIQVFFIILSA
ncbi:hypothetical protein HMPREF0973_02607 [Prevotella veroralis F0319]|uniref:Uncharacterized protein n=1 Tax=Prevotella veroralis F0319 TaxID=649761 RepID=C9MSI8_9BACT|nr:hypothetical protein HMPREF0973_02607 [Prevotella veroralis F0319]